MISAVMWYVHAFAKKTDMHVPMAVPLHWWKNLLPLKLIYAFVITSSVRSLNVWTDGGCTRFVSFANVFNLGKNLAYTPVAASSPPAQGLDGYRLSTSAV